MARAARRREVEPRDGARGCEWSWRSGRRREDLGGVEASRPERRGDGTAYAAADGAAQRELGDRAGEGECGGAGASGGGGGAVGPRADDISRWGGDLGRKRGGGAGGGTVGSGAVSSEAADTNGARAFGRLVKIWTGRGRVKGKHIRGGLLISAATDKDPWRLLNVRRHRYISVAGNIKQPPRICIRGGWKK